MTHLKPNFPNFPFLHCTDSLRFCPKGSKFLPSVRRYYNQSTDWVLTKPESPYPEVLKFDGYDQNI